MASIFNIEWSALFTLTMPFTEIIIRATAMYWFLFLIFRFVIRRDIGSVGIADILLLVIVADASQSAMAGDTSSIADGMVLVSALISWNIFLDWLSFRYPLVRRFAEPSPLCLIRNGHLLRRNMRKEFITEEELWRKLREEGIESLGQVKNMYLEPDGNFSIVKQSLAPPESK